jgi:hypothetical protein
VPLESAPLLPDEIEPAAAAAAGPALARDAVQRAPGAFAAAGALRGASDVLAGAVEAERAADGADAVTHADWRTCQDQLLSAGAAGIARLRAEPSGGALAARLQRALAAWSDPYAQDAAGEIQLDAIRAVHDSVPLGLRGALADLLPAVAAVRRAGRARDHAEAARATAVGARVLAVRTWRAAAEVLLALAPPDDPDLLAALTAGATDDPADDWFDEPAP